MDNLGSRKSESARLIIESAGSQIVLLPPHSPDLALIEMDFAKFKQLVHSKWPTNLLKIVDATGNASIMHQN